MSGISLLFNAHEIIRRLSRIRLNKVNMDFETKYRIINPQVRILSF